MREGRDEPLAVGVVRSPHRIAVVVKLTFRYDPTLPEQVAELATEQIPLGIEEESAEPGATELELARPNDFVRFKPQTDVLLRGLAYTDQARTVIDASIRVAGLERGFTVRGPSPIERMPLTGGFVRAADGESATEPVTAAGPWHVDPWLPRDEVERRYAEGVAAETITQEADESRNPRAEAAALMGVGEDDRILASWWELERTDAYDNTESVSFAAADQRTQTAAWLAPNARFELTGLAVGGERRVIDLPGLAPWVAAETRHADFLLEMLLDTVTIDTETSRIEVVWRGQCPLTGDAFEHEVKRIILTVEAHDNPRPYGIVLRDLQRGRFFRATEENDLRGESDEEDPIALEGMPEIPDFEAIVAKYAEWAINPEPTFTLEQYATVSGDLAAGEPRHEVLKRHDLDEDSWLLEERGWLEKIGSSVMAGNFELSQRYTQLFKEAAEAAKTKADEEVDE